MGDTSCFFSPHVYSNYLQDMLLHVPIRSSVISSELNCRQCLQPTSVPTMPTANFYTYNAYSQLLYLQCLQPTSIPTMPTANFCTYNAYSQLLYLQCLQPTSIPSMPTANFYI